MRTGVTREVEIMVGVISSTHILIRPEALDALRATAPVLAVRGNIGTQDWAAPLPTRVAVLVGQLSFVDPA